MLNFLHKLFNPHCEHCAAEAEAERERERIARIDPTVEVLRLELDKAQREKEFLLATIIRKPEPIVDTTPTPAPIQPRRQPWSVMQRELESKDRLKAAELLRTKEAEAKPVETIEQLEQHLGVGDK